MPIKNKIQIREVTTKIKGHSNDFKIIEKGYAKPVFYRWHIWRGYEEEEVKHMIVEEF